MTAILIFIISASFFDGVSTAQQVFIMLFLLSTAKPVKNAVLFTLGVFSAYLVCGITGLYFADRLHSMMKFFDFLFVKFSNIQYYLLEMLVGVILLISGPIYLKRRKKGKNNLTLVFEKFKNIKPINSFILGGVISSASFPMAIPYILSLEKIAGSGFVKITEFSLVLLYNVVYILPMVIPLTLYLILKNHMNEVENWLHFHTERVNVVVTILMLVGMGLLFIIDSGMFFSTSHPLIKERILL